MLTTVRRAMTIAAVVAALVCPGGWAAAQAGALLPETRYFQSPVADPMAPRISVSLMRTDLLAEQGPERPPFELPDPEAARELVAAASVGAIFPLFRLAEWEDGGAVLVMDGRVFARFRIALPSRDDMGQDWWVGGGIEAGRGNWSGRASIIHRSSHIGDEFAAETGAERIEFGSEQLDLIAGYDIPGVARVYGGGSWIFRSYLGWEARLRELGVTDRAVVQVGADNEWRPWRDPRFVVHAGFDFHSAERTEWQPAFAGAVGVSIRTSRALRLTLRAYEGMSMMGEFFLTRERYTSLEMSAEF
ncbi:hypothetical protein BH23GEM9_BH23GEM9_06510 [soil metagenome]